MRDDIAATPPRVELQASFAEAGTSLVGCLGVVCPSQRSGGSLFAIYALLRMHAWRGETAVNLLWEPKMPAS